MAETWELKRRKARTLNLRFGRRVNIPMRNSAEDYQNQYDSGYSESQDAGEQDENFEEYIELEIAQLEA